MRHGSTYSPYMEKQDRRTGWYLRIGRLSFVHSRFVAGTGDTRYSRYAMQWDDTQGQGRRWGRWVLLLPVMAIGAPVSLWAARTPPSALARLVVPLPPAAPAMVASRQPPATKRHVAMRQPISPKPTVVSASDEVLNIDTRPAMGGALRAALRRGEMQDWSAGDGREGLIVVAPIALSLDGRTCRDTTILTRNGSFEGQTQTGRFCIDAADRITTTSVSAPPQE